MNKDLLKRELSLRNSLTARQIVERGLRRRHRREMAFRAAGVLATTVGVVFLGVFFASLFQKGSSAFVQTFVKLEVHLAENVLAPDGELDLLYADFDGLVRNTLRERFPEASSRADRRELYRLVSIAAGFQLRDLIEDDPDLLGTTQTLWVPASSNAKANGLPG